MVRRHEIQVLRRAGHSLEDTAARVGVSRRTVQRVSDEAVITSSEALTAPPPARAGRPSTVAASRPVVAAALAAEPDLPTLELLRRARLAGYTGGKSALYALVKALRPTPPARPVVRFEGLPGEFAQHDFGQVDVRYVDGRRERVHFFASRLKYSRWVEVTLVPDERVEALVRALVGHYAAWGGLPLLAVFDRPKTIALAWSADGHVTRWNPTFAAVTLDLGLGVELCWPHAPWQKGAVENLVKWVKGSFFTCRRFVDRADLVAQLAAWHTEVNTARPSRATGIVPLVRLREEQARLRPLRVTPDTLALRIPIVVGPTAYVHYEGVPYSMAPDAIGLSGTLYLYRDRVRLVAGRYSAVHARGTHPGQPMTLPEHRAQHLAAVSGARGQRYLQREHLLALGAPAVAYLTALVHRRPQLWGRDVARLHALLGTHGEAALRAAFTRALAAGTIGAEYIAHDLATQPRRPPKAAS